MIEQTLLKQTLGSLASEQSVAAHLVFSNLGQSDAKQFALCPIRTPMPSILGILPNATPSSLYSWDPS